MKMGLHTHHHPLKLNFHQEQHHIKHMTLPKQNLNIKDNVNSINNIDSNNTTNQTKQPHQNILVCPHHNYTGEQIKIKKMLSGIFHLIPLY